MRYLSLMSLIFFLSSCTSLPQMFDTVEKIATDDAITVKVDKDAFQKDTDVKVHVEVTNKEPQVKEASK